MKIKFGTSVKLFLGSESTEYLFIDQEQEKKAQMVVDYFLDIVESIDNIFSKKATQ